MEDHINEFNVSTRLRQRKPKIEKDDFVTISSNDRVLSLKIQPGESGKKLRNLTPVEQPSSLGIKSENRANKSRQDRQIKKEVNTVGGAFVDWLFKTQPTPMNLINMTQKEKNKMIKEARKAIANSK